MEIGTHPSGGVKLKSLHIEFLILKYLRRKHKLLTYTLPTLTGASY